MRNISLIILMLLLLKGSLTIAQETRSYTFTYQHTYVEKRKDREKLLHLFIGDNVFSLIGSNAETIFDLNRKEIIHSDGQYYKKDTVMIRKIYKTFRKEITTNAITTAGGTTQKVSLTMDNGYKKEDFSLVIDKEQRNIMPLLEFLGYPNPKKLQGGIVTIELSKKSFVKLREVAVTRSLSLLTLVPSEEEKFRKNARLHCDRMHISHEIATYKEVDFESEDTALTEMIKKLKKEMLACAQCYVDTGEMEVCEMKMRSSLMIQAMDKKSKELDATTRNEVINHLKPLQKKLGLY
ncbi:hypothetical protein HN014_18200 [Aquimarina sp. TRL1]|uniref:hypothetical protein n=1 Tax=Aquimarina sp. (strain TRL1) TaxID=2736252 RepID=UPI00158F1C81|nr:hypothetical protein [Aquimarina sp. TRL1]QKX06765.1 hypothetical protein HN014_18200 [Aquimarina sp. TRL1]